MGQSRRQDSCMEYQTTSKSGLSKAHDVVNPRWNSEMAQVLMKYLKVDDFENYQVQRAIQDVS